MSTFYKDNVVPVKPPIITIHISLGWIEQGGSQAAKYFDNVQQFGDFLKANPELAKAVNYVPRKNEPVDFPCLLSILQSTHKSYFDDHVSYLSTPNTNLLNTFFREDRNVYSLARRENNNLIVSSPQVTIEYIREKKQIGFQVLRQIKPS